MKDAILDLISRKPKLLDSIKELSIAEGFRAIVIPEGEEIDALANVNSAFPVCSSVLLAVQIRINEVVGDCKAIKRPLYPPMTFWTVMIERYLRYTPSVQEGRAKQGLEALSQGALNPPQQIRKAPDFGDEAEMFPEPTGKE